MHKNGKKWQKKAEIEKKLWALFFLKLIFAPGVWNLNMKKFKNEASTAKWNFVYQVMHADNGGKILG